MENNNMNGGDDMSGNIGTGDAGVLALLADTARAGRGYGWGGEGYGGGAPFASLGSNAVRINRNADFSRLGLDRISDQNEENRRILQEQNIAQANQNGFNRVCDNFEDLGSRIDDKFFQSELRQTDRLASLQREMNENARIAAQCCCDLKLQACEDKAELKAEILAVETRGVQRDLDRAERELQTQKILTTCGCGCGGGVRPCPPQ